MLNAARYASSTQEYNLAAIFVFVSGGVVISASGTVYVRWRMRAHERRRARILLRLVGIDITNPKYFPLVKEAFHFVRDLI